MKRAIFEFLLKKNSLSRTIPKTGIYITAKFWLTAIAKKHRKGMDHFALLFFTHKSIRTEINIRYKSSLPKFSTLKRYNIETGQAQNNTINISASISVFFEIVRATLPTTAVIKTINKTVETLMKI
jgi:hypothetical protein